MGLVVDETGRKKEPEMEVVLREFDPKKDCSGVEAVEKMCDVGTGKVSLFTDLLGDPVSRVRHSPAFLMLVAEVSGMEEENKILQIVGLIRGCVKTVTCGTKASRNGKPPSPLYTKLAYILGLRVSPSFRRRGIATKLVTAMERWFNSMGAEYSYMATSKGNEASVRLFTWQCGYTKFRTPSILVHPVFAHRLRSTSSTTTLIRLSPSDAESLYRLRFSTTEFFPRDIDSVLRNPFSLGTFVAVKTRGSQPYSWPGTASAFLVDPPESWAVLSIWNCKEVFRLEVRGASRVKRGLAKTTRVFDRAFPCFRIPSVPNLFRPFGFYFLYGIGGEGPEAAKMVTALFSHAHNMAMEGDCGVLVTEVAGRDPLKVGIPHWKSFSVSEDLWCVKRFGDDYSDGTVGDWTKSAPGPSIFVDPREL